MSVGKHHCVQFAPRVDKRAYSPFQLVHYDVCGPHNVAYTYLDDYSRATWLCLMKNCSELVSIFCAFCAEIKIQFGATIRILRSDNA